MIISGSHERESRPVGNPSENISDTRAEMSRDVSF